MGSLDSCDVSHYIRIPEFFTKVVAKELLYFQQMVETTLPIGEYTKEHICLLI